MTARRAMLIRMVLLAAGLAFVGYLVAGVGPGAVLATLETLSWGLVVVVALPFALFSALHTLGWRFAFPADVVPFGELFWVRLAGETLNVTLASVGGDPVKAYLLRPRVPLEEGVATILVDKTTTALGQGLFLALGLAVGWTLASVPPALLQAMAWLLVIEVVGLAAFAFVQVAGTGRRAFGLLTRLGVRHTTRRAEGFARLDRALARFYRRHPRRLVLSVFWHFLGWAAGALEAWLILWLLGVPVGPLTILVIEAINTAVRFLAFMLPAAIGAMEGANVAVFSAFGLDPALGLSFMLIRRIRQIVWMALGLTVLGLLRPAAPVPAVGAPRAASLTRES